MNLGQLLLVVGAMALLATLSLSINSSILRASVVTYDSEATVEAISIGQAMVDEILTQDYDSLVVFQFVKDPALFTPTARLGRDADSEKTSYSGGVPAIDTLPYKSQLKFNDIDDYNNYTRIVTSPYLGKFTVNDTVYYVLESDKTTKSNAQTWYKKILVSVTHPNLLYPVVLRELVVYRKYIPPS